MCDIHVKTQTCSCCTFSAGFNFMISAPDDGRLLPLQSSLQILETDTSMHSNPKELKWRMNVTREQANIYKKIT